MTYFTASWEGTKEGVTVLDRECWWEPFGFFEQLFAFFFWETSEPPFEKLRETF